MWPWCSKGSTFKRSKGHFIPQKCTAPQWDSFKVVSIQLRRGRKPSSWWSSNRTTTWGGGNRRSQYWAFSWRATRGRRRYFQSRNVFQSWIQFWQGGLQKKNIENFSKKFIRPKKHCYVKYCYFRDIFIETFVLWSP